jgi:hypothetical protein
MCLLLLGPLPLCHGESRPKWKKAFLATIASLAAANAADAHSSAGRWETNPLLRDSSGRCHSGKAILIKTAASGGFVLLELILLKKMPNRNLHKSFALTNIAASGVVGAVAVRNYRMSIPRPPDYLKRQ